MRKAILPVTDKGAELAKKISAEVGGQIFLKSRDFDSLKVFVAEIFAKFDALIFIGAAGIAVRMIAPHVASKLSDPAVIVVDERGKNVISLLSGHVGGGNFLTAELAGKISANPVITTATDVSEKFSADAFASRLGLTPFPKDAIKIINSAILRGEEIFLSAGSAKLNLLPQNLICGVGCRRGTQAAEIFAAVESACKKISQPAERIKFFASVDLKSDEVGLLEVSKQLGKEIKFFSAEQLAKKIVEYKLAESDFVKKTVGVGNVCEAAALCAVGRGKFALTKTKFDKVTVALLWQK